MQSGKSGPSIFVGVSHRAQSWVCGEVELFGAAENKRRPGKIDSVAGNLVAGRSPAGILGVEVCSTGSIALWSLIGGCCVRLTSAERGQFPLPILGLYEEEFGVYARGKLIGGPCQSLVLISSSLSEYRLISHVTITLYLYSTDHSVEYGGEEAERPGDGWEEGEVRERSGEEGEVPERSGEEGEVPERSTEEGEEGMCSTLGPMSGRMLLRPLSP
ncbi:hypothetical protein Taro_011830 [Colocasia esculenta]|uniref:Uncharacterized protein n=1 Tax=Colocasia esculenta TaxID=4460 RepID=A0A843UB88_COLES|nr:hypothetical protein [Colocasia esculenta]